MAVAAGIANYSNEIERHRIAILFLGLAGFYRDFCSIAWEEDDSPTERPDVAVFAVSNFLSNRAVVLLGPFERLVVVSGSTTASSGTRVAPRDACIL
jgi:hypothetical protein